MRATVLAVLFLISLVSAKPSGTSSKTGSNCGYQSCHPTKDGLINVHIVPHTHDDVGWLKTVDQYFYGSKTFIQKAGVQYILDSVVDSLSKDPNRRFIYVETAFFWKWWMKQHDIVKAKVRKFVKNGQLEFVGGAWSMNDEATTHYQSTIDQFSWGLRKLNDTFGECGRPKVGWQIDPFGHSREMASLLAQMGYDGLLLGRVDYQDKSFRFQTKSPEMIWRGSDSLGSTSELFTSIMYNTYSPPPGFCFDVLCADEPIIDDKKSPDYNVDSRVKEFLDYVKNVSTAYQTNQVLVTMGEDFNYQDANMWFKNLDKLIVYGNALQSNGSKYNLIYSTPSCYLKAVQNESMSKNIKWNVKDDDFFPYASDPHAFWTGYFTSRPTLKRFERLGNNFLQVCKQLYALTDLGPEDWGDLNLMREAMGVMQHHDAITGTEKQHVANDYARILSRGFDECDFIAASALSKLVTGNKFQPHEDTEQFTAPVPNIPFQSCLLANISQCNTTENLKDFVVTVYNPLSRPVNHFVRLPVVSGTYSIKDPEGNTLPAQLSPIHPLIEDTPGRTSKAKFDLVFKASDIPPLGFKSYYVSRTSNAAKEMKAASLEEFKADDISVSIDPDTGLINGLKMNGKEIPISQKFYYYRGTVGDNRNFENRSSGAYIFRPNGSEAYAVNNNAAFKLYKGEYTTELHQEFSDWSGQVIRLYTGENFVEFDWIAGPIPDDEINGREIISRYSTQLISDSTFYTDSNGRELLKRVRNFRPTWKLNLAESVAGNYYPVTSRISIRDQKSDTELSILTERAQGGSSLKDGEIELMVHRKCLHDDAFGVDEALDETAFGKGLVAKGKHYLVLGPYLKRNGMGAYQRLLAQRKILEAWTFVSPTNSLSYDEYRSKYKMQFSGLNKALPDNVQILTLEPWKGMGFLLRLEHIMEKDEDTKLSQPVTVNLKNLFAPFKIQWFKETTLAANQWLDKVDRLKFSEGPTLEDFLDDYYNYRPINIKSESDWNLLQMKYHRRPDSLDYFLNNETGPTGDNFDIKLSPMQIRTFLIEIQKN